MDVSGDRVDRLIGEGHSDRSAHNVPWQIWVVIAFLAVEGFLGNLPLIPNYPPAAIWFAAKCLFVVGLLKRWRWVFVLFLVVAVIHVLEFSTLTPFVAFLNLVLVLLAASSLRFYFPKTKAAIFEQPHPPDGTRPTAP